MNTTENKYSQHGQVYGRLHQPTVQSEKKNQKKKKRKKEKKARERKLTRSGLSPEQQCV